MMNLRELNNEALHRNTKKSVERETEATTAVLWHLREVERRKLFASMGYSSLFKYAVRELRYSEGSAARRIDAMRLLKQIPEVEVQIQDGSINLTHLTKCQQFFRAEKRSYSSEEKLDLVL